MFALFLVFENLALISTGVSVIVVLLVRGALLTQWQVQCISGEVASISEARCCWRTTQRIPEQVTSSGFRMTLTHWPYDRRDYRADNSTLSAIAASPVSRLVAHVLTR